MTVSTTPALHCLFPLLADELCPVEMPEAFDVIGGDTIPDEDDEEDFEDEEDEDDEDDDDFDLDDQIDAHDEDEWHRLKKEEDDLVAA